MTKIKKYGIVFLALVMIAMGFVVVNYASTSVARGATDIVQVSSLLDIGGEIEQMELGSSGEDTLHPELRSKEITFYPKITFIKMSTQGKYEIEFKIWLEYKTGLADNSIVQIDIEEYTLKRNDSFVFTEYLPDGSDVDFSYDGIEFRAALYENAYNNNTESNKTASLRMDHVKNPYRLDKSKKIYNYIIDKGLVKTPYQVVVNGDGFIDNFEYLYVNI